MRAEQQRRQRRAQRKRAEGREQHRYRDGQRELLVDLTADAADESHRDEHRRQNEGDGNHGRRHFRHGLRGGFLGRHAVIDMALHRFHHHDGVVHHDPDGQHQSEHARNIDGEPEQREDAKRADDRHRNREQRNQRCAPVLQEDEDHQKDQRDGFHQGLQHILNGGADEHGGVVRHHVVDSLGEAGLHAVHELDNCIGGLNRIGAGSEIDDHVGRRPAVQPAEAAISLRAEFDTADIANAQQRGVGLRAHHDILELAGICKTAGRGHRILKVGAARRRRLADRARGILAVLRLHGVRDVGRGNSELGHLVRVQPDAHGVDLLRTQARFADAGQAADLVHQVDLRVIGKEECVVAVVAGHQADGHQERCRDLLDGHTLALHFGWQAGQRDIHAVLRLHRRDIGIGAQLEGDVDDELAVVGAGGLVVQHAIQSDQLFFDGLRDRLFQILRVAAQIGRRDLNRGRHHLRISRNRQAGNGDRAEDDDHDGDHHREHRTIDEKFGHDLARGPRLRWRGLFLIRHWMDHQTRTHGEKPFHHHAISGLQPLFDQPGVADACAGLHDARFDLVPLADRENSLDALILLHGALRHQDYAGAVFLDVADAPELAGQQAVLRIGKLGLQLQGAGPRIHLVERVLHFAGLREDGVIGQDQFELQAFLRRPTLLCHEGQVLRFANFETNPNWVQRDNRGERLCRVRIDQAADGHQRVADQAADRRLNGAVLYIERRGLERAALRLHLALGGLHLGLGGEPCLLHVGLVGANAGFGGAQCGHRGVKILLRGGILFHQRFQTLIILLGLHEVRLRGRQIGLRLAQRNLALRKTEIGLSLLQRTLCLLHLSLERPQVQNIERLAGSHFLAWPEEPFFDVALHPAANIYHVSGVGLSRILDVDIGVSGLYLGDFHGGRRRLRRDVLPFGPATHEGSEQYDQENPRHSR